MTSVISLLQALTWISQHNEYHDFKLERQPSEGFTLLYKEFRDSDWEYIP